MRKTLGICLLTLLLTGSAFAGEMPNGSPTPPPPPQPSIFGTESPTSSQQMSGEETAAEGEMPNGAMGTLTQIALDLLAVWPALL